MMLVSIYHMILTGEEFQPTDYESLMNPKSNIDQSLTVEKAALVNKNWTQILNITSV